jgi:hypothetical protein
MTIFFSDMTCMPSFGSSGGCFRALLKFGFPMNAIVRHAVLIGLARHIDNCSHLRHVQPEICMCGNSHSGHKSFGPDASLLARITSAGKEYFPFRQVISDWLSDFRSPFCMRHELPCISGVRRDADIGQLLHQRHYCKMLMCNCQWCLLTYSDRTCSKPTLHMETPIRGTTA